MKFFLLAILNLCVSHLVCAEKAFDLDNENYRILNQTALSGTPLGDKGSNWHNYTKVYAFYFSSIRDKPLKFLEIGIYKGASVALWESYFPNAELHFVDISVDLVQYQPQRATYHVADQSNSNQLESLMNQIGDCDIILDDGGHTMEQQLVSFKTLFPHLNSGGLYIIEDLHTSYWTSYGGGGSDAHPKAGNGTMVQFLKDLVEDVNYVGARTWKANHDVDLSYYKNELTPYREQILGIHFYDSLCIVIKR